jgi:hypothetical protein
MSQRKVRLSDHIFCLNRCDTNEQNQKDRIHQRILSRVEHDHQTGCAIYTGVWEESGQAKMRVGRKVYCLSRIVAWIYRKGFDLWGHERALRTCNNPACCAEDHIVVVEDQAAAMRHHQARGRCRHKRKINDPAVIAAIRTAHKEGATIRSLAGRYGVGRRAIRRAMRD